MPRRADSRRRSHLEPLGAVLRAYREAKGLTQMELGEATGRDFNYIGGVERGERNFSITVLLEILEALGHTLIEFAQAAERERARFAKR